MDDNFAESTVAFLSIWVVITKNDGEEQWGTLDNQITLHVSFKMIYLAL